MIFFSCLKVEGNSAYFIYLTNCFPLKASQHFGNILSQFIEQLASTKDIMQLPSHLKQACIVYQGALTPLYEYIPRMRESVSE